MLGAKVLQTSYTRGFILKLTSIHQITITEESELAASGIGRPRGWCGNSFAPAPSYRGQGAQRISANVTRNIFEIVSDVDGLLRLIKVDKVGPNRQALA